MSHPFLTRPHLRIRIRDLLQDNLVATDYLLARAERELTTMLPAACFLDTRRGLVRRSQPLHQIQSAELERQLLQVLDQTLSQLVARSAQEIARFHESPIKDLQPRLDACRPALHAALKDFEATIRDKGSYQPCILVNQTYTICGFHLADPNPAGALPRASPRESWVVYVTDTDLGSYWDPPTSDLLTLESFPQLEEALLYAHQQGIQDALRSALEACP